MTDRYLVTWLPAYSVGIAEIDAQHQALIGLIRQLQEAMQEGRGRSFQQTLIEGLVVYTIAHFRFEEQLMRTHGYPALLEHIGQHRVLTSRVRELRQKIQDGQTVSNASVMQFLRSWLTDHIMEHDQKFAPVLRGKA